MEVGNRLLLAILWTNGCFHFCRINKKSYWETKTRYGGKTEKNKIKVKVSRTKKGAKISHLRSFKKKMCHIRLLNRVKSHIWPSWIIFSSPFFLVLPRKREIYWCVLIHTRSECLTYSHVHCKKNSGNIIAFMIRLLEAMIHFSKL